MVKFANQLPTLKTIMHSEASEISPQDKGMLTAHFAEAGKLKSWVKKQKRAFRSKMMDEKKISELEKWNESHSDETMKEALTAEEIDVIRAEVKIASKEEQTRVNENAIAILKYLSIVETTTQKY